MNSGNLEYKLDLKAWNDCIEKYIAYTHKTAEQVAFRQTKNLLWFILRRMPQSKFSKFQKVSRLSDYLLSKDSIGGDVTQARKSAGWAVGRRLINKTLSKGGFVKQRHTYRGVTGKAYMYRGSKASRVKFGGWVGGGQFYSRAMAIKENEKVRNIIRSRLGFANLLPLKAIDELKKVAMENGVKISGLSIKGNKPDMRKKGEPAMIQVIKSYNRTEVRMVSAYRFKTLTTLFGKPQAQNANYYNEQFRRILPLAMTDTINDMKSFLEREKVLYITKKPRANINEVLFVPTRLSSRR